jgi:hypothetical protein
MKEGLQYGDINLIKNESFNDAKDLGLSYTDRCIGVDLQWSNISIISIQFLYSNNRRSSNRSFLIPSRFSNTFMLTSNEEINKINLYQNSYEMKSNIVGIQFRTTMGRKSAVFGSTDGHFLTESFEHYTFGYAKGRQQNGKGIEMLQFVWIKQTSAKEQIATGMFKLYFVFIEIYLFDLIFICVLAPRSMLEMCEFTFTAKNDSQFIHAKGIESSWHDLKQKFNRQGAEYNPTASYYEKTSDRGPKLFAIVNNNSVFYHDNNEWYTYVSARNITCSIIPSFRPSLTQKL